MNAQPNLGMQVTTFENPMGIDGFEFVEFAAPAGAPSELHALFKRMGFSAVLQAQDAADHRVPPERREFPGQRGSGFVRRRFRREARPQRLRLRDPLHASRPTRCCKAVLGNGGETIDHKEASKAVDAPVVKGIGDCMLYLVDRYGSAGSIYDGDYAADRRRRPRTRQGFGLTFIDHLTHNLYFGNMQKWSDYYERLFNFREIRYFDIKGAKTGLVSKAMTAPDGIVRIPLNESNDPKSQINEYLDAYKGEGIQHIACFTDDIYDDGRADARGRRRVPRHARHAISRSSTCACRTTARTCRAWRRTRS